MKFSGGDSYSKYTKVYFNQVEYQIEHLVT